MSVVDTVLLWLLRRRGFTYPSAIPPELQHQLREHRRESDDVERSLDLARYHAERVRKRNEDIDAMAAALGVIPVPRRRADDAPIDG